MEQNSTEPSNPVAEVSKPEAKPTNAAEARAKLRASIAAELKGSRDRDDEPKDEPKAKPDEPKATATKVEARIEAKEAKLEDAGVDVPDQKKGESNSAYELRLAKLLAENEGLKREHEKASKELGKLQKLIAKDANPLDVLDALGLDFEKLVMGLNPKDKNYNPKWTKPGQKPSIPDEVMERIAALEKDKKDAESRAEAEKLKSAAEERNTKDVGKIQKFLDANAEDFPYLASVPWGAQEIVNQCNARGTTDAGPILRALEENLAENTEKLVTSDKAMRAALKRNPELRKTLKVYFAEDEAPKIKKGDEEVEIKGVSDLIAEPPARSPKKSKEDMKKSLAAELREKKRKQAEKDGEDD
jgi:hypothetical protein